METTTTETQTQAGKPAVIPVPLDKMKVGHAGLYVAEEDEVESVLKEVASITGNINSIINDAVNTTPIVADIELGIKGAAKTLIDCEGGIKAFVKELAEDKENGLPNKETGVWIHYLTQGIMNDFHRTWTRTPVSLEQNKSRIARSKEKGKRVLSKKDKNELLAKLDYRYYEDAVNTGEITQAEAFTKMAEAAAKKKELEDAGYYLSPNKTTGVCLFDWKSEILAQHNNTPAATKIYTKNNIEVVVPNVVENFYKIGSKSKPVITHLMKTPLEGTRGVFDVFYKTAGTQPDKSIEGGLSLDDLPEIKSNKDLWNLLNNENKFAKTTLDIEKNYEVKGIHITKITASGQMKPRQVCIDCVSKKDGGQHLFLLDKEGGVLHFQN